MDRGPVIYLAPRVGHASACPNAGPLPGGKPKAGRTAAEWIGGPSFIQYLVEIKKLAGDHGQRGMFGRRERGIRLAIAIVQEFARVVGVRAVVMLEIVVCLASDGAFVGGQRACQ